MSGGDADFSVDDFDRDGVKTAIGTPNCGSAIYIELCTMRGAHEFCPVFRNELGAAIVERQVLMWASIDIGAQTLPRS